MLGDIFDLLANSEFLNTKLNRAPNGSLAESEYVKVIGSLNLGLTELYKRFNLRQEELRLHILPGVSRYFLRDDRVANVENMDETTYIEEVEECLEELRVIKVMQVRTEMDSYLFPASSDVITSLTTDAILPLNDNRAQLRIISIAEDILHIYPITAPRVLVVVYQAFPEKIAICEDFDPATYELEISDTIIDALIAFTASRILVTYEGESSNGATKSMSYLNQYEMACQKIEQFGLQNQINDRNTRFERDGWT